MQKFIQNISKPIFDEPGWETYPNIANFLVYCTGFETLPDGDWRQRGQQGKNSFNWVAKLLVRYYIFYFKQRKFA